MPPSSKMPYPTAGAGNSSGDDSPESGDDSPGSGDSLSGEESLSDEEKEKGQQSTAYSNTLPASTDLPSITAPDAAFTTMTGYSDGVWTTITYAPSLESAVPGDRWGPPPPPPNAAHHRRIEIAFAVLGSIGMFSAPFAVLVNPLG